MAGKPGRSGGKRAGAGRKPAKQDVPEGAEFGALADDADDLDVLHWLARNPAVPFSVRAQAAANRARIMAAMGKDAGKKAQRKEAAEEAVGAGKFTPAAPPKLVVNNG